MNAKQIAAERAVDYVKDGMIVGLGTGSTAYFAIQKIGSLVKQGMKIKAIASSQASDDLARQLGIPLLEPGNEQQIDVSIDGADEVDTNGNLIKGGGGALLREKILATNSKKFFVVVDESKLVTKLGKFKLPVEIIKFGSVLTLAKLEALGGKPVVRQKDGKDFNTDNGNLIADCSFYPIEDPKALHEQLKQLTGVVETGIFPTEVVTAVIAAYASGETKQFDY
ncbi:ribose-5-phosphate isomerase RpiA [Pseudochryseolinea flava]|uniref:Ribose-5-phosphate isomerase A n=1 Tax=Pseudochryseolinea flava TaxID=2059302 RepID=A0A364Y1W0_9BACT|nr:ribose-5-phosphate isomerase RpiA [Pseudochryseolinea flava]RAW00863.1 ribose 5-phosphate isomerase A [Pseudochryseolinea flava]